MKKQAFLAVLVLVAAGVFVKQVFFSGGPDVKNYQTPQQHKQQGESAEEGAAAGVSGGSSKEAAPAKAGKSAPAAQPVNLDELAKSVKVVDFLYDQANLPRNPMTPLVGPQAVFASTAPGAAAQGGEASPGEAAMLAARLAVTGIIWDKKFPVAVINDDVVSTGDTLPEGAVVQSIEPDRVVLKVGQMSVPISLKHTEEQ